MKEGITIKSKSFSVGTKLLRVLYKIQHKKHEYNLTNQLIRSSTSIHANAQEGTGAGSRRDFTARLVISRKETYETLSWIEFLIELDFLDRDAGRYYLDEYTQILKMLNSSIRTLRHR